MSNPTAIPLRLHPSRSRSTAGPSTHRWMTTQRAFHRSMSQRSRRSVDVQQRRCAEVPETVHGIRHPIEVAPAGGIAGDEHDGRTVRTDARSDPDQPPEPVDQGPDRRCPGNVRKHCARAREVLQAGLVEEFRIRALRFVLVRIRDPDLQVVPGRVEEGRIVVRGRAKCPVYRFEHPITVRKAICLASWETHARTATAGQPELPEQQQPAQIFNQPASMRIRVPQQIFVGDDEMPSARCVSRELQVVVQPQQVGLGGAGDGGGCGIRVVGPARQRSKHRVRPAQHLHHHHPLEAHRELRQPDWRQAGKTRILEQQGFVRRLPPSEPLPDPRAGPGCLRARKASIRKGCGVVPGPAQRANEAVVDVDDVPRLEVALRIVHGVRRQEIRRRCQSRFRQDACDQGRPGPMHSGDHHAGRCVRRQ